MNKYFYIHCVRVQLLNQPAFNCSKLAIEALEQVVKYVQS